MGYFVNKTIWLTGASSGIGEALAIALAKEGAQLVLSARREDELQRVANLCGQAKVLILPMDLADIKDAPAAVDKILSSFGRIDILINNAGVSQRSKAIETDVSIDRMLMEVNFMSAVTLTKAVLPVMIKNNSGQIIALSSILGDFGLPLHSTYAAAKHAVNGFFESLAEELSDTGIGVSVISPGFIKTNVAVNAITGSGSRYNIDSPAQQKGMPADVCATKILDVIMHRKRKKYIGRIELLFLPMHQYAPKFFYWIMKKLSKG
jgi:short-subunit dehydrogenase